MDSTVNADGTTGTVAAPDAGTVQDGGNQAPGWIAQLPDDLKGNETFTGFKTIGELAKAHLDTSGKVAELEGKVANSIPKLTENATDEERAAYLAALGVPESPDGYEFEKPELPEGMAYDDNLEKWFRAVAHAEGIPKETAKKLYEAYNAYQSDYLKLLDKFRTDERTSHMETLKKEWANKFDDNVKIVQAAQEKIGLADPAMKEWLEAHNAGNDPVLIKWILANAHLYTNDNAPPGKPGTGQENKGTSMTYPSMKT